MTARRILLPPERSILSVNKLANLFLHLLLSDSVLLCSALITIVLFSSEVQKNMTKKKLYRKDIRIILFSSLSLPVYFLFTAKLQLSNLRSMTHRIHRQLDLLGELSLHYLFLFIMYLTSSSVSECFVEKRDGTF